MLNENDSFEKQSYIELLQNFLLALLSVIHLRPAIFTAYLLAKVIDIVPKKVEKIHTYLWLLFLTLAYTTGSRCVWKRLLAFIALFEDLESDWELKGQTCVYFDDEEHCRDRSDHTSNEREYCWKFLNFSLVYKRVWWLCYAESCESAINISLKRMVDS